jgi:hypothetical protein
MFGREVDPWDWDYQSIISLLNMCRVECAYLSVDPGGIRRLVDRASSVVSYDLSWEKGSLQDPSPVRSSVTSNGTP